jgi:hypothetical protein
VTEEPEVGWRIVDPDGNVVASGPLSAAHLTGEVLEQLTNAKEG